MASGWRTFVKQAIEGEPDDPFVHLLRQRIEAGSRIVRVQLDPESKAPGYRVLLERLREFSEMRVPHSPSFTRWSLGAGVRMASLEDEAHRFALLAQDRFQPLADDLGSDYFEIVFLERVRALTPDRTAALLSKKHTSRPAPGREHTRATRAIDAALRSLACDLGRALRYSEAEAAAILDVALERFATQRFHLELHELWPTG